MKHTKEQKELSESLLAACRAAGIEKPRYVAQDEDGAVAHNLVRPSRRKKFWMTATLINHPPYADDWRESLLEWVEPQSARLVTGTFGNDELKSSHLPNYAADLNACHECVRTLTDAQRTTYRENLSKIWTRDYNSRCGLFPPHDDSVNATARQRCEAYLRTIGKWKE